MIGRAFTHPKPQNLIPHGIPGKLQATFQKTGLEPPDVLW